MAKKKTPETEGPETTASAAGPLGTYIYVLLKGDGTVLTSYGAGVATLDSLLSAGWTALRETPLTGGGVLLVLRR